jgi:hypothetical protein
MRPIYTEKIQLEGTPCAIEGFTPDEKFLILADGTRYRFELLEPGAVDLSIAKLLEVARLSHDKEHRWIVNRESLYGWLNANQAKQKELGDRYWEEDTSELFHRRCELECRLRKPDAEREKKAISAVAWFLDKDPATVRAKEILDQPHSIVLSPQPRRIVCLLRTFHRQEAKPEQRQRLYSVKHAEQGGNHFLRFCWSSGKLIDVKLPCREASIAWQMLLNNPGKWISIPELMGRETTSLPRGQGEGFSEVGNFGTNATGSKSSVKSARQKQSAIEKRLRKIAEDKEEFEGMDLSAREEDSIWQALESDEERLKNHLAKITKNNDIDPFIPGASTWGVWKSRLLDALSKKDKRLAKHLADSLRTESGSIRFTSELLRWVD